MSVPNQLTILRIILTPFMAVALIIKMYHFKYVALTLFFLASLTDWYDGHLARKYGKITPVGKYLDPLADKLLVLTAFGMFAFDGYFPIWMFWVVVIRDILITGLRTYTIQTGKNFHTSLFAKWKTAVQMAAIYVVFVYVIIKETYAGTGSVTPALIQNIDRLDFIVNMMFFVTIYTALSGAAYLIENRQHLKGIMVAFYRVFVPTNIR